VIDDGLDAHGEGAAGGCAAPMDLAAECGNGAAAAGIGDMTLTQERLDDGFEAVFWVGRRPAGHAPDAIGKGPAAGLHHQLVARGEMPIEPAMGQAGVVHQVGETDALDALLAEQHSGALDDAGPRFSGFFLRSTHENPSPAGRWPPGQNR
jgi:hypothetical protein